MDIIQLEGKRVKICPSSIKAMDENGKTCGMVTGVRQYKKAPTNQQFDHFKKLRESGLWGSKIDGVMDRVFIDCGKLYYLHDLGVAEFYQKHEFLLDDERNREHIEKMEELAQQAAQYMTVVNVYIK